MVKLSVIIPVYNVEQYLPRCLESVIHQTFKDIEIICVNDCSPDNCLAILQKYAAQDQRIKIVNLKINKGLSGARNAGLEKARGEYIYFIDSDDWIDLNYLEKMIEAAVESHSDLVINTSIKHVKDGVESAHAKPYNGQDTDKKFWKAKNAMGEIFCVVWNKLYRHDFIQKHELSFPENIIHEDFYFQYACFVNLDKVYTFDGPFYYYFNRADNIMNTLIDDDLMMIKVYNCMFNYLASKNKLSEKNKLFYIMPSFKISDENRYKIYKAFFEKIEPYFLQNKELYNDIEVFFANNILNTSSFEEYKSQFPASVVISYLRRKK